MILKGRSDAYSLRNRFSRSNGVMKGMSILSSFQAKLGEMGVLPNHAPSAFNPEIWNSYCPKPGKEEHFTVAGGIVEVQPEIITVLADAAENVKEIDVARAEAARRQSGRIPCKRSPPDTDAYLKMEAALKRSNLAHRSCPSIRPRAKPAMRIHPGI